MSAARLLIVTTLAPGRASREGSSRPVKAKCPRWLVPNCISKPSVVTRAGMAMTPALLTRMSNPSWLLRNAFAKVRMESRSARSSDANSIDAAGQASEIRATASSPLFQSRQASITWAPWVASCRAVS